VLALAKTKNKEGRTKKSTVHAPAKTKNKEQKTKNKEPSPDSFKKSPFVSKCILLRGKI
jgi:hypothetical protein